MLRGTPALLILTLLALPACDPTPTTTQTPATSDEQLAQQWIAAGLPWQDTSLLPKPPADQAKNAAPALRLATNPLRNTEARKPLASARQAVDANQPDEALRLAQPFKDHLDKTIVASRLPVFHIPHGDEIDRPLEYPYLANIRTAGQWLIVRGEAHAQNGQFANYAQNLQAVRRLARLVSQDVGILPWILATNLDASTTSSVIEILPRLAQSPSPASDFQAIIPLLEPNDLPSLESVLKVETAQLLAGLRNVAPTQSQSDRQTRQNANGSPRQDIRDGIPRSQETRNAFRSLAKNAIPISQAIKDDDPPARTLQKLNALQTVRIGDDQIDQATIGPDIFARALKSALDELALRAATRAYIEALAYKSKNRRWPQSLADLPTPHLDPYNPGQPLRLNVKNGQVTIQSKGASGQYDIQTPTLPRR